MGKYMYRNLEELYDKLQGIMYRKRKEDVMMDLPEITRQHIDVPLTKKELNQYQTGVLDVAQNDGILAAIVYAKVFASSSAMRMNIDMSSKEKEAISIINDLDERCVLFTSYKKEVKRLEEMVGKEVFALYGGVPKAQRMTMIDDFEATEDGVLLMTNVGVYGLNLQKTRVLIHMDLEWTYARMEQRLGRIHRIGSPHNKVFELTLTSKDTIDKYILDMVQYRKDLSDITVDGAKKKLVEKMRQEILVGT